MRILGVDTATWRASVGVLIDGEVVAEHSRLAGESHAVSLLPLIDEVLQRAACSVRALDGVAVSCGPGSFTGLRIGLSVAKGMACAAGLRLVAVPTLEALARTVADHRGVICAVLDARKGEVYAACFESAAAGGWRRLTADKLVTPESLLAMLPTGCTVLGDAVPVYGAFLRARLAPGVTLLPFERYAPRGGVVAAMGWKRMRMGLSAEVHRLEPVYIRPSEAEMNAASS
ncbi:MAG: tRNA (adenosine(37)-N6)-threonylcarbamoyltransferase complex dimerization subunit type 1 TsaB [Candidatus Binatia bacterium]